MEGGNEAKIKLFETLSKKLYDVIIDNPAKIYYSSMFSASVPPAEDSANKNNKNKTEKELLKMVESFSAA